jgi:tRNA G46 methylase TrmB
LELVWKKTIPGGLFEIATDFEDYYQTMMQVIGGQTSWKLTRESVNERLFDQECLTNYELKYKTEGRKLYYLELKKA